MSVTVERETVPPGQDDYVDTAWELKEAIRQEEELLKQEWGFFSSAYRRSTVYVYRTGDGELIGFATVRSDGYILFLAVDPAFRDRGFGERLVGAIADDYSSVSCHARATNENALGFYEYLGFDVERRIDGYYEDGGAAYYLRLGDRQRLRDRISELFNR